MYIYIQERHIYICIYICMYAYILINYPLRSSPPVFSRSNVSHSPTCRASAPSAAASGFNPNPRYKGVVA